ncbi:MAG: hypothetical protein ACP5LX_05865 [Nitrososphaeria archaeon]
MSEEEIKGLVILIQEYKEALRTTLPLANVVVDEQIGSLMNQCTQAIKLLEDPKKENLERAKKLISSIITNFESVYEEIEQSFNVENEKEEDDKLTFLSDFLYYSSGNGPS